MGRIAIDGVRLYQDLQEHFGTMKSAWSSQMNSFLNGALGEIETAWQTGDYDRIIQIALDEGFDLDQYRM